MENLDNKFENSKEINENSNKNSEKDPQTTNKNKKNENIEKIIENNEIAKLISSNNVSHIKSLIKKAFIASETNDINTFNYLLEKITFFKNRNFDKEELESLVYMCDKIIVNNFKDLYSISIPIEYLNKTISTLDKKKLKLDWKIYYKLYFTINGYSCYEFSYMKPIFANNKFYNLNIFFSKVNKYFTYTEDDIKYIRSEILNYLKSYDEKIIYGLKILNIFYPKNELAKDKEIQEILFKMITKTPQHSMMLFGILQKVIKDGLLISMEDFIDNFFNLVNNVVSSSVYIGQGFASYKKKKNPVGKGRSLKENYTQKPILTIISALLLNDKYAAYRNTIDKHFKILLNIINFNLKENSIKEVIKHNLDFIKLLLKSLHELAYQKKKIEVAPMEFENEYVPIDALQTRLKELIEYLLPILKKALFYDEKSAIQVLSEYKTLTSSLEINKSILDAILFISENSENNFIYFISKFTLMSKALISNAIDADNKEVFEFILNIIRISIEKISSVSIDLNTTIINMFTKLNLIIRNYKAKESDPKYKTLYELLSSSAVTICKKIVNIFSMLATANKSQTISFFLVSCCETFPYSTVRQIQTIFYDYITENIIEKQEIKFFFSLIYNLQVFASGKKLDEYNLMKKLFEFCYKSLLTKSKDSQANQSLYLGSYNTEEKLEIDIFNDKKLKFIKQLLKSIYYEFVPTTPEFKTQIFNIISEMLKQSDIKYHKISSDLLAKIIHTKLNSFVSKSIIDENKYVVKFPQGEDLNFLDEILTHFLIPYQKYIDETMKPINNSLKEFESMSKVDKNKAIKTLLTPEAKDNLERVITIYFRLSYLLSYNKLENFTPFTNPQEIEVFQKLTEKFDKLYTFNKEIIRFMSKLKIKNSTVELLYIKNLFKKYFDGSDKLIKSFNDSKKSFNKLLTGFSRKEKISFELFDTLTSYHSYLRPIWYNDKKSNKVELIQDFVEVSKKFVSITDKKVIVLLNNYVKTYTLYLIQDKKVLTKMIDETMNGLTKKISKMKLENNSLLISDKTTITNILTYYESLLKFVIISNKYSRIEVLQRILKLLTLLADKNYSEIGVITKTVMLYLAKIKFVLPKEFYLVDKKLDSFPQFSNLEKEHKTNSTKKLDKLKGKNSQAVDLKKAKLVKKEQGIKSEIRKLFNSFYENLALNSVSKNVFLNFIILIQIQLTLLFSLNIEDRQDYELLSKFEVYYLNDLTSDSNYIQKRVSLILWSLIMKIKHKHFKQIKVTKITDEEYQKQKEEIILNTKSNFSGLSNNNLVYLKSTNFLSNNCTDLDANLMNLLKKKENLLKLIDSLIFLKDTMNDQSLLKGASLIKLAFGDKIEGIESLLGFIQNPHGKKILNNAFFTESQMTQNLFDHLECDFISNLYHVYGLADVFDYDAIFQVFNGVMNESKKDKLVCINILLHVLGGKLKIDTKLKNYKGVFENIFKVMEHFTNGTNKRIDGDILKFFTYVIHCFTVNEFNKIFYEDGKLRLFEFEKDFQLKFLNLVFKRYDFKISYVFNNSSKETEKFNELVASYLSDKESLVKNLTVLKTNLTAIIFSKGLAKFNLNNLEYDYQRDELRSFFENILTISKTIDIKEIKQICYHLIFVFKAFFIKEELLLNDYLLDISKITYLDIEEFEKHLNLLRKVFQFPCYKLNLGIYIKLIGNTLLTLDNIHSRKFLIDLLTNLFKSNINNYNSEDFYMDTLNGIFKMIDDSQYEIKEYIVNNLLTYFINTLDQEINHKVIDSLNSQITNKSDNFVYKFVNPVSIIFVLGSYLKMFNLEIPKKLQSLIVELKSHNSKIFKNRGAESKLIKTIIADFYNKYKYTFNYARSNMTEECYEAILELSRTKSYFV